MDATAIFVRGVWKIIPPGDDASWVDRVAALPGDNTPCGDYGPLIRRMLEAGITRQEIARFAQIVGYEVAFDLCYHLDDPAASYEEFDDDAPNLAWGLFQLEGDRPSAPLSGVHESLLTADPSGREMRPPA